MKRIVIESYTINSPYVGLGEFCKQLGNGLAKQAPMLRSNYGIELYFIVPPQYKGCFGKEVHYINVPVSFRRLLAFCPFQIDIFHMPHQYCLFKHLYFAKKVLMTVHDINFIYEKKGEKLQRSIKRFNNRLSQINFANYISEFAREDTNKYFDIQVPERVIYNGVTDLSATPPPNSEFIEQLPTEFMFHISSLLPKKNVHLLIEMMQYLPERKLVIAGNWESEYGQMLQKMIKELPTHNVYALPNVTEEQKAYLYSACQAFLFPSLCEGFGLPPVEAMKFGKPLFLSTLTSLPEIGGDSAYYWKDLSPESMAEKVREHLSDFNENKAECITKIKQNASRFNWDDCVEQYINYYIDILTTQK